MASALPSSELDELLELELLEDDELELLEDELLELDPLDDESLDDEPPNGLRLGMDDMGLNSFLLSRNTLPRAAPKLLRSLTRPTAGTRSPTWRTGTAPCGTRSPPGPGPGPGSPA